MTTTEPAPGLPPIAWAVYLGADTSQRLAREWDISVEDAKTKLRAAVDSGVLVRAGTRRMPSVSDRPNASGPVVRVFALPEENLDKLLPQTQRK